MSRIVRFFPPLVTGTVITSIGMCLFPVAINWAGGGKGAEDFGLPVPLQTIPGFMRGFWVNISVLMGPGLRDLGMVDSAPGSTSSPRCTSARQPSTWRRSCRCAWW